MDNQEAICFERLWRLHSITDLSSCQYSGEGEKQACLNVGWINREFYIACRRFIAGLLYPCLGQEEKQANKMDSPEENRRAHNSFRKHRNSFNLALKNEKRSKSKWSFADRYWLMVIVFREESKETKKIKKTEHVREPPHPTLGAKVMKPGTR